MHAQASAKATTSSPAFKARVSKRLTPGQNGTKRLQADYGESLVCVRYRQDGSKRYTTVELVIAEQVLPPRVLKVEDIVAVAIGYQERDLRARAKKLGARWSAKLRLWIMSRDLARTLGIENRIQPHTGDIQIMDISTIGYRLPYMDIRYPNMAIKLPHMEMFPYVEVVSNLRYVSREIM